ncbi:MAG: type II toxin-antitoxin system RelE/ParE family toxin [Roseburia sp.]|nr:type II toxin-antitoxin system RelE/ParE family toxin [Roseburia sp.]
MFEVMFYRDKDGKSEISDYLDDLEKKSETDKNARVNKDKILAYMIALGEYGTRIGKPFIKHIEGDLWELRPLRNRIFFFYWKDNRYVLLHYFIKKTQKTPKKEIEKAKSNLKDYLERNE